MSDGSKSRPSLDITTNGMLIPESIADAPTQRFYATSLFVFLQALKFYDYIQLYGAPPSSETVFAVKWIAIDSAYLLLIPKLKIPWLSFGLTATFLQIAIVSVFNICLSARIPISLSTIGAALLRIVYDRELSVLEHNVKVSDLIHNSSRILGKHTVNILPESTAKLNPLASCYCVDTSHKAKAQIHIPIRLNSTIPIFIEYSRIDPETNQFTRHNITGKRLKGILKNVEHQKKKVWDMPLPVSEPGLYRLERVQDDSRLDVRLYRAQALVVTCPSAKLIVPERLQAHPDRCTGDLDELSLRVTGLPPLRVKYNRWIEGRERVSTIDSVKPVDYSSPLMIAHHDQAVEQKHQQAMTLAGVQDLLWAKAQRVDVYLNSSLQQAGLWSYSIEEVEDACGNVVNFKSVAQEHSRVKNAATVPDTLAVQGESTVEAPNYQFRVHERPSISFRGCTPENPTKLLDGHDAKLNFDFSSPDGGPFEVQIGQGSSDALVPVSDDSLDVYKKVILKSRGQGTTVSEPGLYTIQAFSSEFCKGVIQMPNSCIVYTPPKPSLSISFDSIQDKCAGSIGLLADLSFTGAPPFDIAWKVTKDGKAIQHRKKVDRARHQLRFTPEEAGHFSYEFTTLDDLNYKGIRLEQSEYRKEQTVYPLAGASFIHNTVRKCCIDDAIDLPVRLVGSGPWDLVYEINHSGKRQRFELNGLNDPHQIIKTPSLKKGGTHTVTLVSVQDAKGCKTPLQENDAVIEIRRDRPSAAFYTIDDKRLVTIIEGSMVELPLRLLGDGPWTIKYQSPEKANSLVVHDQNGKFAASTPGRYVLQEVRDAYCPGNIDQKAAEFEIQWFPRPTISIPEKTAKLSKGNKFVRQEICEADDDMFEVQIFGAPPFAIQYERSYIGHKGVEEDRKSLEINAALPTVSIKSKSFPAGIYRYNFQGVSDARYDASYPEKMDSLTIEQFVNSRPQVVFVEPEKTYNYCMEVDLADQEADRIPLNFKGQAPFKARFRIKHELTGITEYLTDADIQTHTWSLQVPKQMLTLGKHIVSVAEVSDANGCLTELPEKSSQIYIAISEQPSILPVSARQEFCVGDRISYALQGTPPFKIEYDFNGSQKRATVNGPAFSRVAEKPGDFSILSISDSASNCKVAVNGYHKIIHDIPSVRVSEGKTIIESIHEGDQAEIIFHLYGTPPFSLTYTRSEVGRNRQSKVLETHTVSGIWEPRYVVHSSVAGTFAATEVHDAHCRQLQA